MPKDEMRELTLQEAAFVSGGNANSGYEPGYAGNSGGGAPSTCANNVGAAAIIGALTGIPGGPGAMAGLAAAGAASASLSCPSNSPYGGNNGNGGNQGGGLGGNSDSNSVNGQCNW